MRSQVSITKYHYCIKLAEVKKFQLSYFKSERRCCESAALNMPAHLENSAVATGLENVSFHSNTKERQCQRMLKLRHNCTHLTCNQSNAQNSPSQSSTVHEPRTFRYSSWIKKRQRNHRSRCQHLLDHRNSKRIPEKTFTSASLTMPKPLTVWITTNCGKFFKRCAYQNTLPPSAKPLCRSRSNS